MRSPSSRNAENILWRRENWVVALVVSHQRTPKVTGRMLVAGFENM